MKNIILLFMITLTTFSVHAGTVGPPQGTVALQDSEQDLGSSYIEGGRRYRYLIVPGYEKTEIKIHKNCRVWREGDRVFFYSTRDRVALCLDTVTNKLYNVHFTPYHRIYTKLCRY